jgi:hypothetical protein
LPRILHAHLSVTVDQCALPAFEGLFPGPHDGIIQDLLYYLVLWNCLAKLRMHTDPTLELLDSATTTFGTTLRHFVNKTCNEFHMVELPSEAAAHARRQAKKVRTGPSSSSSSGPSRSRSSKKVFNMKTYKLHTMGDYIENIRTFGMTDSYSTQMVHNMA